MAERLADGCHQPRVGRDTFVDSGLLDGRLEPLRHPQCQAGRRVVIVDACVGAGTDVGEAEHDVATGELDADPSVGELVGQLEGGLAEHLEHAEVERRLQGADQPVDDGGDRLVGTGHGLEVATQGVEVRRQVHDPALAVAAGTPARTTVFVVAHGRRRPVDIA